MRIHPLLRWFDQTASQKWLLPLMGHLFFLTMLVMSIVWYKERMLAMDSAYYAFKMIVHQGFFTGHERYISYIPQLLPLLGIQLGWSLKAVLIAYSAGFILFYYAAYNLLVYLFRNPQAGLFLALALGLSMRYKFYGPVGEIVLSIVYLSLLIGWLTKPVARFQKLPPWADVAIGILIATLLVTSHPFVTISAIITLGFVLLYQKEWVNPRFWITSIYTGIILLYNFAFTERNAYEAERTDRLGEAWQVFSHYQDYYIFRIIYQYFDAQYALPFIAFLLSLVLLFFAKRYLTVIYLSLSFAVLLSIVIILHAYLNSNIYIMLDGYLVHLGLVWALPMAFYWGNKQKKWMMLTLAVLLVFSLARIADSKAFFQKRLAYLESSLQQHTNEEYPKAVVYQEDMNYEKLWIGWAMGCETLLLSSLDGPQYSRNIYMADKHGDLEGRFTEENLFLSVPFGPDFIKRKDLPKQYFQLPTTPYREVELN